MYFFKTITGLVALAVHLVAHVLAEAHPPDLALAVAEAFDVLGGIGCLNAIPPIKVALHITRAS